VLLFGTMRDFAAVYNLPTLPDGSIEFPSLPDTIHRIRQLEHRINELEAVVEQLRGVEDDT
jgi:hypothetical protein